MHQTAQANADEPNLLAEWDPAETAVNRGLDALRAVGRLSKLDLPSNRLEIRETDRYSGRTREEVALLGFLHCGTT